MLSKQWARFLPCKTLWVSVQGPYSNPPDSTLSLFSTQFHLKVIDQPILSALFLIYMHVSTVEQSTKSIPSFPMQCTGVLWKVYINPIFKKGGCTKKAFQSQFKFVSLIWRFCSFCEIMGLWPIDGYTNGLKDDSISLQLLRTSLSLVWRKYQLDIKILSDNKIQKRTQVKAKC